MSSSRKPAVETVIGPYSLWPRRRVVTRPKADTVIGGLAAAALVLGAVPMVA